MIDENISSTPIKKEKSNESKENKTPDKNSHSKTKVLSVETLRTRKRPPGNIRSGFSNTNPLVTRLRPRRLLPELKTKSLNIKELKGETSPPGSIADPFSKMQRKLSLSDPKHRKQSFPSNEDMGEGEELNKTQKNKPGEDVDVGKHLKKNLEDFRKDSRRDKKEKNLEISNDLETTVKSRAEIVNGGLNLKISERRKSSQKLKKKKNLFQGKEKRFGNEGKVSKTSEGVKVIKKEKIVKKKKNGIQEKKKKGSVGVDKEKSSSESNKKKIKEKKIEKERIESTKIQNFSVGDDNFSNGRKEKHVKGLVAPLHSISMKLPVEKMKNKEVEEKSPCSSRTDPGNSSAEKKHLADMLAVEAFNEGVLKRSVRKKSPTVVAFQNEEKVPSPLRKFAMNLSKKTEEVIKLKEKSPEEVENVRTFGGENGEDFKFSIDSPVSPASPSEIYEVSGGNNVDKRITEIKRGGNTLKKRMERVSSDCRSVTSIGSCSSDLSFISGSSSVIDDFGTPTTESDLGNVSTSTSILSMMERFKRSQYSTQISKFVKKATKPAKEKFKKFFKKKGEKIDLTTTTKKKWKVWMWFRKRVIESKFFRALFNLCILLVVIVNVWYLFFRCCFSITPLYYYLFIDVPFDFLYFVDFLLKFFFPEEAYQGKRKLQSKGKRSLSKYCLNLSKYIFHYSFLIDFISIIPIDYGFLFWSFQWASFLRLTRTLKMFRFGVYYNRLQVTLVNFNKSLLRLIYFISLALTLIHVVGCIYFLLMSLQGESLTLQFVPGGVDILSMSINRQYIRSFYWSLITLTGYFNAQPKTNLEIIFSFVCSCGGLVIYIGIISSIGSLYNEIDVSTTFFQQKMDEVNEFIRVRKLKTEVAVHLRNYYEYMWKSRRTLNEDLILEDLPVNLRVEILISLNRKMIEKVPFFLERTTGNRQQVNNAFISLIVLKMKPQVAPPGCFIIRAGSIGRSMYFISKGKVEVLIGNPGKVVAVLESGNYFGEVAILLENTKRTASIRSAAYTDLFVIDKGDFIEVLGRFPEQKKIVEGEARKRKLAAALLKLKDLGGK